MTPDFLALIDAENRQPVAADVTRATAALRDHYGSSVAAVLFYGSCLREKSSAGLLDFYVLVDRLSDALPPLAALGAALLPPNVYHHRSDGTQAKVAVMTLRRFLKGLGPGTFTSTLSARFAQPVAVVYARNEDVRRDLAAGFAAAVECTFARTAPLLAPGFTARDLWRRAFAESFAAELRPEGPARIASLVDADLPRYQRLTPLLLEKFAPRQAAGAWRARRVAGKTLNALRLIKAAFTFRGGLDYAAWKIRRHSGVDVVVTDADRRKPLRAGLRLFVHAWRRGGLR